MSSEHLSSESSSRSAYSYAHKLEFNPDPNLPAYEMAEQSKDNLPELSESQIQAMQEANPSRETLEALGLPVGKGIAAFKVGDEVKYYNIDPTGDYGTSVNEKRIKITAVEQYEHEAELEEVQEELGETALEAADVPSPVIEIKLHPADIARAEAILGKLMGSKENHNTILATQLWKLGATPEEVRTALDPNKGNEDLRKSLLLALERELDVLGDMNKLPERVQANDDRNTKTADASFNHEDRPYTSREYAARIALAMLDGSFNYRKSKQSRFDDLAPDDPRNGQHRQAAEMVIASNEQASTEAPKTIETENEQLFRLESEIQSEATRLTTEMTDNIHRLEALRDYLSQNHIDDDQVSEYAVAISAKFDDAMSSLGNLLSQAGNTLGSGELIPADATRLEDTLQKLRDAYYFIDGVRNNDMVYDRIARLSYYTDSDTVQALQLYAHHRDFDELHRKLIVTRENIQSLGQ